MKICKVFISQPMRGLSDEQILANRQKAEEDIANICSIDGIEPYVLNTIFTDELGNGYNPPIFYLSLAIKELAKADLIYFCEGWEKTRGCVIEHDIAKAYGVKIIHE